MKKKWNYFIIFALAFALCSGCNNKGKKKEGQTGITEKVQETNAETAEEAEKLPENESETAETDENIEEEFETGEFDGSDFD